MYPAEIKPLIAKHALGEEINVLSTDAFFSPAVVQLQRRHEQMKKNLEAQHKELEEKRRVFEEDRANWEIQQRLEQQKMEASRYGWCIHCYTVLVFHTYPARVMKQSVKSLDFPSFISYLIS